MPFKRLPDGSISTSIHPLRERFREYMADGEGWDDLEGRWKTYPEMAYDLDPSGRLSGRTVWTWMALDFPEVLEVKARVYRDSESRREAEL
jgi:hypothetical protein